MSLDYILPNGVTMGFSNPAERDAYLSSDAGAGAQTQEAAMAANPGQSMEQIKNQNYERHYGPGGAGFGLIPRGAERNGGANPVGAERNWGANPDKARWISQQTGYRGDFGDGSFNQWSQQNGINGAQLEQQWAQQQGVKEPLAPISGTGRQPMGFGGQPTMGFGQNNWASMPGMQGLLNGFGNQPTKDIGWATPDIGWRKDIGWANKGGGYANQANNWSGPSDGRGAAPDQANTSHNMLWSW